MVLFGVGFNSRSSGEIFLPSFLRLVEHYEKMIYVNCFYYKSCHSSFSGGRMPAISEKAWHIGPHREWTSRGGL
jgi:hypothetical protein